MAGKLLIAYSNAPRSVELIGDKIELCMNHNSGCVFLSDEDGTVLMMNGDKLERFYSCPECGAEGFIDDGFNECSHLCSSCHQEIMGDENELTTGDIETMIDGSIVLLSIEQRDQVEQNLWNGNLNKFSWDEKINAYLCEDTEGNELYVDQDHKLWFKTYCNHCEIEGDLGGLFVCPDCAKKNMDIIIEDHPVHMIITKDQVEDAIYNASIPEEFWNNDLVLTMDTGRAITCTDSDGHILEVDYDLQDFVVPMDGGRPAMKFSVETDDHIYDQEGD